MDLTSSVLDAFMIHILRIVVHRLPNFVRFPFGLQLNLCAHSLRRVWQCEFGGSNASLGVAVESLREQLLRFDNFLSLYRPIEIKEFTNLVKLSNIKSDFWI